MVSIGLPPQSISAKWKYALLGGVASIPFTMVSYWQTGSEMSLAPVLFGGLLAGVLAKRMIGSSRGVGARAGLVGALPVLWVLGDILPDILAIPNPEWFSVLSVIVALGTTVIGFAFAALLGEMGGRIGGWLSGRGGQVNQTQTTS